MNPYELMLIFDPGLGEERIDQILLKVEDKIKNFGGEMLKTDKWGIKTLANAFKKARKLTQAYYAVVYFNGPSSLPASLQAYLKVTENVIRYSVYRSTEQGENPLASISGEPLEKALVSETEEKKEKEIG